MKVAILSGFTKREQGALRACLPSLAQAAALLRLEGWRIAIKHGGKWEDVTRVDGTADPRARRILLTVTWQAKRTIKADEAAESWLHDMIGLDWQLVRALSLAAPSVPLEYVVFDGVQMAGTVVDLLKELIGVRNLDPEAAFGRAVGKKDEAEPVIN